MLNKYWIQIKGDYALEHVPQTSAIWENRFINFEAENRWELILFDSLFQRGFNSEGELSDSRLNDGGFLMLYLSGHTFSHFV